jgi:hypothetical protein
MNKVLTAEIPFLLPRAPAGDGGIIANLSFPEPIHEAQKMSESDKSTLAKVVPR